MFSMCFETQQNNRDMFSLCIKTWDWTKIHNDFFFITSTIRKEEKKSFESSPEYHRKAGRR